MNKKVIIALVLLIVAIATSGYFIINKVNNDKRTYQIEKVTEYKYFVVKTNEQYGVIDKSGNIIIDAKYDRVEIPNPSRDIFICYKGEKGIAMNANNQQLYAEYNSIEPIQIRNGISSIPYEKTTLKCEKNNKYGLIDLSGKNLLQTEYDSIETFSNIEGQLQIEQNGKFGVANIKGTILIKPEYDKIDSDNYYNNDEEYKQAGYIVGKKNEDGYKYGYINSKGKLKLKIEYNDISRILDVPYKDGIYLIVAKNGQYGVIKDSKNIIENEYQNIEYDNTNDVFIIQKGKNYGVADNTGKNIIPVQNTSVQAKGKYIYVERNNIQQVYDASGNKVNIDFNTTVMPTQNDNYKITINLDDNKNYYGVVDNNNKQIIKPEYLYLEYAFDNYFIACGQDGKLGILDSNEKTVIELKYDLVQKIQGKDMIQTLNKDNNYTEIFSKNMQKICEMENATIENQNNYLKVYSTKGFSYYDSEGKVINSSKLFPNNKLYAAVENGKWGYVDANGNSKIDYEYELATEVNQYGYAAIKKDGKWGCIDSNGNIIADTKYELNENYSKADFIGEYIRIDNGFGNEYYTNDV